MRRAVARDMRELVDPEPISDMFNAFSALGDHERFVVDSTIMNVEETTDAVVRFILKRRTHRWVTIYPAPSAVLHRLTLSCTGDRSGNSRADVRAPRCQMGSVRSTLAAVRYLVIGVRRPKRALSLRRRRLCPASLSEFGPFVEGLVPAVGALG